MWEISIQYVSLEMKHESCYTMRTSH